MTDRAAQDATTDTESTAQDAAEQQDTTQEQQPTGFDALPKETQDEIRALRRENAKYRKSVKDYEDANKSQLEKLESERDDYKGRYESLELKLRDSAAESAFIDAATKANARAPKTLFRAYKSDLEFDDDGAPKNIAAVLKTLQKDEPDLFKAASGTSDAGRRGDATGNTLDMNEALRELAGKTAR